MTQDSNKPPAEQGAGRPRAGLLAPALVMAAIVVLIAIALVSFH